MKLAIALLGVLVAVNALTDQEQWISFKARHEKTFKSLNEEHYRFQIFQANLRIIEAHNARYEAGKETYEMGVNQFTDLTTQEFENSLNKQPLLDLDDEEEIEFDPNFTPTLDHLDWREKGAVLPVQDQGDCGSCWAFSIAGAIEGQNYIKNNQSIALSVQDIMDCSRPYGTNGCRGGWTNFAVLWVADHGITTAKDYPYKGVVQECISAKYPKVNVKVTGYAIIGANLTIDAPLLQALENLGPVSTAINAQLFQFYKKGIFNPENYETWTNHDVLTVGYGSENGLDYWIMKNSWGTGFGEDGYIRIIRNNKSTCGLHSFNVIPKVVPNI